MSIDPTVIPTMAVYAANGSVGIALIRTSTNCCATGAPAFAGAPVAQQFVDVLISAIPTEPLAAYTAIVGITVGSIDISHPHSYLVFRWFSYAAFLIFTL